MSGAPTTKRRRYVDYYKIVEAPGCSFLVKAYDQRGARFYEWDSFSSTIAEARIAARRAVLKSRGIQKCNG